MLLRSLLLFYASLQVDGRALEACPNLVKGSLPSSTTSPHVRFDYTQPGKVVISCVGIHSTFISFYSSGAHKICPPVVEHGPEGLQIVKCNMTCIPENGEWSPGPPMLPVDNNTIYCETVDVPVLTTTSEPINSVCKRVINGTSDTFPTSPFVDFNYSVFNQVQVTCIGLYDSIISFRSGGVERTCDSARQRGPDRYMTTICTLFCDPEVDKWSPNSLHGHIDDDTIYCSTVQIPDKPLQAFQQIKI
ncbi:unnamed protein product [Caenorhabditis auriculariae]|uniref:Sushi domain-containing protein n=1 Tax=Caenorhabditis auriculariae TaxID=2777116 RepID=A0A8S1HX02_9PELO|nr:unnamed protein product [Caenorhabditis auriculariae]